MKKVVHYHLTVDDPPFERRINGAVSMASFVTSLNRELNPNQIGHIHRRVMNGDFTVEDMNAWLEWRRAFLNCGQEILSDPAKFGIHPQFVGSHLAALDRFRDETFALIEEFSRV